MYDGSYFFCFLCLECSQVSFMPEKVKKYVNNEGGDLIKNTTHLVEMDVKYLCCYGFHKIYGLLLFLQNRNRCFAFFNISRRYFTNINKCFHFLIRNKYS